MRRGRTAVAFLVLAMVAIGSLQLAAAAHNIPRDVTLKYSERKDRFKGKIESQVADCLTGVVTVHRSERGPNPIVASGSAGPGGGWSASARAPAGRYYATTDGFQAPAGYCPRVRSRTLHR